jgi:hypothetical protein
MMPLAIVPVPMTPMRCTGRGDDLRRVGAGVGVEAAAGLAAEQTGGDVLLEDRRGGVSVVARLRVHRLEDLVGRVQADEVEQGQRTHRVAGAEAHRGIDVLARGVPALIHPHGVVEVAEQQRIRDESGAVTSCRGGLADACDQALHVLDDSRVGDDGLHDLDQPHDRRRVEPVQADDARRAAGGGRQLGHRQR